MTHKRGNARSNLSYVFPKESSGGIRKLQKKFSIVFIYESKKKKKNLFLYQKKDHRGTSKKKNLRTNNMHGHAGAENICMLYTI